MSGQGLPPAGDAASRSSTSSEVARRILARDALAPGRVAGGETPEAALAALEQSCARVTEALRNSIGDAGCAALLVRALTRTERAHPLLTELRGHGDAGVRLDGIAASAAVHGIENVSAAIAALIAAVVDILARLVGEDMAIELLAHDGPQPPTRGEAREP